MKNDIDFDELDKAVGAVLGSSPVVSEAPVATGQPVTADSPAASKSTDEPSVEKKPAVEAKPAKPATATKSAKPSSPALKRSSGRFMDMVHPSADMKKPGTASKPTAVASHAGVKLQPLSADLKPAAEPEPEPTPTPVAAQPSSYEPGPPDMAASGFVSMPDDDKAAVTKSEWPDPLEVDSAESGASESTDADAKTTETPATEATATNPEPVDGPFLNDQKVEKRPLGAFAVDKPGDPDETQPVDQSVETPEASTDLQTAPAAVPLELQPEAVEVEASEVPEKPEDAEASSQPIPGTSDESSNSVTVATTDEAKEAPQTNDTSSTSEEMQTAEDSASKPVDTVNLSGQSIAPQYKSQPTDNEGTQAATSVFDTKEYHQPLTPSVAQKSLKKVASLVGLVVLLVLIGAAIGYAYYVYRTGGF